MSHQCDCAKAVKRFRLVCERCNSKRIQTQHTGQSEPIVRNEKCLVCGYAFKSIEQSTADCLAVQRVARNLGDRAVDRVMGELGR